MSKKKTQPTESSKELYRSFDPARGSFDPTPNDKDGQMHPGKSEQDRLPKEERPRYQEWLKRQGK